MRFAQILFLTIFVIVLAGCASTSVFAPYPNQIETTKQYLASSQYAKAQDELDKKRDSSDKILYMMERGRVSFLAKDFDKSIKDFNLVINEMDKLEEKAKVTVTGSVGQGASMFTNDNAIPYHGEGYERVFVHHYQALNYAFTGDLEAAGVEVRRANLEQQRALKKYENEIDDALKEKKTKNTLNRNSGYANELESLSKLAGQVKNSFQNAYTFYVSALIYDAMGEDNSALIDYKKALEIFPDNKYLIADVTRLAKKLGIEEDYERLKGKASDALVRGPKENEGKVVILYEYGYAPKKQEIAIPFGLDSQIQMISLPTYNEKSITSPPLKLLDGNMLLAETQKIVDVSALAAKALQEKMPMIIVRQISRIVLRQQAKDASSGNLLGAVASIGHLLLNSADRRSWLTLPASAQIAHTTVEAGEKILKIAVAENFTTVSVSVQPNRTTIVYVYYANGKFNANSVML